MCNKKSDFKAKWLKVRRGAKLHNEYMQPDNIKKTIATLTLKDSVGKWYLKQELNPFEWNTS
jgi:hypothetical protein